MIEPYRDADAPEVSALLAQVPEVDDIAEDRLRAFAAQSFNRGGRDFRVVRSGGRVVAFVTSALLEGPPPTRHARIVVHPEHRRRGLGTRLVRELSEQEAPSGVVLQGDIQGSWAAARRFVDRHGFTTTPIDLLMSNRKVPDLDALDGVSVRAAAEGDEDRWIALHEHGHGERDDFTPLTRADLALARAARGFTLLVAEVEGRVVGLCHGSAPREAEGFVHSLVVEAQFRRRGIGGALTAAVVRELRAKGAADIALHVAIDNPAAIAMYESLGFAERDRLLRCQRVAG